MGSRERCTRFVTADRISKAADVLKYEPAEVPPELRAERERLGFDFGKFDFVMHDGEPILLDANRTPGIAAAIRPHDEEGRAQPRGGLCLRADDSDVRLANGLGTIIRESQLIFLKRDFDPERNGLNATLVSELARHHGSVPPQARRSCSPGPLGPSALAAFLRRGIEVPPRSQGQLDLAAHAQHGRFAGAVEQPGTIAFRIGLSVMLGPARGIVLDH